MIEERSILEEISEINELDMLNEFLKDDNLEEMMDLLIKLIAKPGIEPGTAQQLIVKLQAISAKYAIQASIYTTILRDKAGTENNHKKNIYYTLNAALDRVVDSLKYVVRMHV